MSAVGRDQLGDELLRRLQHWQLDIAGIARPDAVPTGFVRAEISPAGDARYTIAPGVAWDQIPCNDNVLAAAGQARALVFGSLAQRSAANRVTLEHLLAKLPAGAERVFDVNLRPPHDDPALVHDLARHATLLKLNAAEAARLAAREPEAPGREEVHARLLAQRTGCTTVCVTAGVRGAGLLAVDRWLWEPGRTVEVADTVGSGDAFLAALVTHRLGGKSAGECLARACRAGEWVATQRGATPPYPATARLEKR